MSRTPAAHLARVKVAYPAWTIRAIEPGQGTGYTAHRPGQHGGYRSLYAPSLGQLEHELNRLASTRQEESAR